MLIILKNKMCGKNMLECVIFLINCLKLKWSENAVEKLCKNIITLPKIVIYKILYKEFWNINFDDYKKKGGETEKILMIDICYVNHVRENYVKL